MTLSIIYLCFIVELSKDIFIPDYHESNVEFDSDYKKINMMQWIIHAIFSVMIIVLSLSLMFKLKVRYGDFYAKNCCYLWAIFTWQALSMLIMTTIEIIRLYDDALID